MNSRMVYYACGHWRPRDLRLVLLAAVMSSLATSIMWIAVLLVSKYARGVEMIAKDEVKRCEAALMGSLLLDHERVGPIWQRHKVCAHWFDDKDLARMAELAIAMLGSGKPVDPLSTLNELRRVTGPAAEWDKLIEHCLEECPTATHAEYYVGVVQQESVKRMFKGALRTLDARVDEEDPGALVAEAAEILQRILTDHECHQDQTVGEILLEAIRKWREARANRDAGKPGDVGVPMPWWRLTKIIGGLPNDLVVLAARPSVGKTALEGCIRVNAAMRGYHVLGMLMDMGADRVLPRDLCRMAKVSMLKLKFGYARHDQLANIDAASVVLSKLPMSFVQRTNSLEVLSMRARHAKAKGKLDLITIDHAQLCGYAGCERHDKRAVVTRVTAHLKLLAQELKVPVLLLSQLKRAENGAELDREPQLDDLRDSGSLEQDAAIVMMLHRDFRTEKRWEKDEVQGAMHQGDRPVKLFVRKNQDGGIGWVNLLMNPAYFIFHLADEHWNMAPDDDPKNDGE